jgi:hypothetical protein
MRKPHLAAAVAALVLPISAAGFEITRGINGLWYDPAQDGHGLSLQLIGEGNDKRLVANWYTFDLEGDPLWLLGIGLIQSNQAVLDAVAVRGGRFTNDFAPESIQRTDWGELTLTFSDCQTGSMRYSPNDASIPAGTIPLQRLTNSYNVSCTGGISDDRPPVGDVFEIETFLHATGIAPTNASGDAEFAQRAGYTEFDVDIEDLPAGEYTLLVGGVARGVFDVIVVDGKPVGKIDFSSPNDDGDELLLSFDPRGQLIEVADASSAVVLEGVLDPTSAPPNDPGTPPATGNGELYVLEVEPQGDDGPSLEAELLRERNAVEFEIELENVPVATYSIEIDGVAVGELSVANTERGSYGELEFRNPVEFGKQPLTFDPRGSTVAARGPDGSVVLSGTLPAEPGFHGDNTEPPPSGAPSFGDAYYQLYVELRDDGPELEAELDRRPNEIEFDVDLENVPLGDVIIRVGGQDVGVLNVLAVGDGETRGELGFSFPRDDGDQLLDFDPRGQLIEAIRAGEVIISGRFPTTPSPRP